MKATEHKVTGERMQLYEIGYLIVPSIAEDKVADEVSSIHSHIEKNGGTIIAHDFPKLMDLSYSMSQVIESKKQNYDSAYFGWVKFEMPVSGFSTVESELKKSKSILRHLSMKTVRENTIFKDPSALSAKGEQTDSPEEKKANPEDEIDKSIDALVIS